MKSFILALTTESPAGKAKRHEVAITQADLLHQKFGHVLINEDITPEYVAKLEAEDRDWAATELPDEPATPRKEKETP